MRLLKIVMAAMIVFLTSCAPISLTTYSSKKDYRIEKKEVRKAEKQAKKEVKNNSKNNNYKTSDNDYRR
ncbi:MAG: hypothetical protein R3Y15_03455 [Rikenellaceae bacterium]